MFAPRLLVLCTESLVEQSSRPFVAAVSFESLGVVGARPVRCLVFDEITILQSRESSADRALVDADLRGDFAGLERPILVGGEEPESLIRDRKIRELVLARVLEGISVDGHR